jgi:hypothetical protein
MCADRWVFSHDQGVLGSLAEIASERGYTPRFEQIGEWRGSDRIAAILPPVTVARESF